MIEFKTVKQCVTSDGQKFDEIVDAQIHQLTLLIPEIKTVDGLAGKLIADAEQVIDILSIKSNSHPRARKLHGAKRAKKTTATAPAA